MFSTQETTHPLLHLYFICSQDSHFKGSSNISLINWLIYWLQFIDRPVETLNNKIVTWWSFNILKMFWVLKLLLFYDVYIVVYNVVKLYTSIFTIWHSLLLDAKLAWFALFFLFLQGSISITLHVCSRVEQFFIDLFMFSISLRLAHKLPGCKHSYSWQIANCVLETHWRLTHTMLSC